MASTYENDLRLEEMATGENSGSWGTKTNTNLELIADAFSYGTETIADADTTITIADGAADAARSLALKINSSADLTTTRTITLAPNTTSKVWIIENNTSGGQTLTISAGSGSNITLANGTTKIIATDGIGAGSNVVELTQDLAIADLFVDDDLTVGDDIIMNSDGAKIDFGSDSEIQLTHVADTGLLLTETGGGAPTLQFRDSALAISSSADGQLDIDSDGTIDINATTSIAFDTDTLYVDSANNRVGIKTTSPDDDLHIRNTSQSGATFRLENSNTSTDASTVYGTINFEGNDDSASANGIRGSIKGQSEGISGQLGLVFSTANGNATQTEALRITSAQRVLIGTDTARSTAGHTAQLQVAGSGSFSEATVSIVGNENNTNGAYINFGKSRGTTTGSNTIVQNGDVSGQIQFTVADGTDMVSRVAAITAKVDGAPGVDDTPGLLDFSTTLAGASDPTLRMRIDNAGNVGINTTDPSSYTANGNNLVVADVNVGITLASTSTVGSGALYFADGTSGSQAYRGIINYLHSSDAMGFHTGAAQAMTIDSSQRVLIGLTSDLTGTGHKLQVNDDVTIMTFDGTTTGADGIRYIKSRASTPGSNTIVADGDDVGFLDFRVDDGTDYASRTAVITSQVDGTPGVNDTPGRLVFYTTADGASAVTERMRIESTGTVNIGSVASNRSNSALSIYRLGSGYGDIRTSSNYGVALKLAGASDNTDELRLSQDNLKNGYLYNEANAPLLFGVNNIERMRIQNDGVGIARSTLTEKFEVAGSINSSNQASNFNTGTYRMSMDIINSTKVGRFGTIAGASTPSGSEGQVTFMVNSAEVARLTADGITFGGDTAAANALDDYEEGTWTPSVGGATTDPTVTYGTQAGFYVKIGRMVHISMYLNCTAVSGGAGAAKINGIPFSINNAGSYFAGSQMEIFGLNVPSNMNNAFLRANGNSSHLRLEFVNTLASSTGGTGEGVGTDELANNFRVLGSFTYMTS